MKWIKTASCASASITVMVSVSLMVVMSLLFSLVELARVDALSSVASLTADRAVDSAFSQYNKILWDEYGVLYFDGGYGSAEFDETNLSNQIEKYAIDDSGLNETLLLTKCITQITGYRLATDNGGRDFIGQACDRLWISAALSSLESLKTEMEDSKSANDKYKESPQKYAGALAKMNKAESERDRKVREAQEAARRAREKGETPPPVPKVEESEQVVEFKSAARKISTHMNNGITGLVLGSDVTISAKGLSSDALVSERMLNQGVGEVVESKTEYNTAFEDVLFAEYLKEYFSCYCNVKPNHGMSYELEYILCKKETDKENLEATIERLLGLRLVENLVSLYLNGALHSQATALSTELATALWVPELAPIFDILIIVAWSFVESVLDIRTLLDGGKIPMVKNTGTWTSDLYSIATCLDNNTKAKEVPAGITYQGYINQLIYFESRTTKAYRAMDMMEETLMQSELTKNSKMDNMISKSSGEESLYAEPLFLSLVTLGTNSVGEYCYNREFAFTYY